MIDIRKPINIVGFFFFFYTQFWCSSFYVKIVIQQLFKKLS